MLWTVEVHFKSFENNMVVIYINPTVYSVFNLKLKPHCLSSHLTLFLPPPLRLIAYYIIGINLHKIADDSIML